MQKVRANQAFILALKRRAHERFFAELSADAYEADRLGQTFAAEFSYLENFQRFLGGMSLNDVYGVFDKVLAMAPWNDSLRARIYAQYSHIASTQTDPAVRQRLMRKADELYDGEATHRTPIGATK